MMTSQAPQMRNIPPPISVGQEDAHLSHKSGSHLEAYYSQTAAALKIRPATVAELRRDLALRGNHAGIEARKVQAAVESRMLDLHASVHDHIQPSCLTDSGSFLVP